MAETSTGTQAVDRAAQLVSTVVHADQPLSFADLQEASGLAKSTTSRMLTALERTGLVERDAAGSYVAGSLFWLYAARHDPWEELVRLARPAMERIGEETAETVHLSVTRGEQVVQVAQVDSRYLLGTRDWTEIEVPAHTSSLGKVFYAWGALPVPTSGMHARTVATITDAAALERDGARCSQAWLRRHGRRARGRPHRHRRTRPRTARRRRRGPRHLGTHPTTGEPARRARPAPVVPRHAALHPAARPSTQGGRRMTPGRDPPGPVRRDPRRQRAARPRADRGGARDRHGAADAALRRADPVARGGRRPVRARRLLRAGDADRRPRDGRRDGAAAPAARRDRRRRRSASS